MSSSAANFKLESLSGGGNFFENILNDAVNIGLNIGTYGTVGYKDGSVTTGVTGTPILNAAKSVGKSAVGGLKEITGAKAAEEANAMAREQYNQTLADAKIARADQIKQVERDQVSQSMLAGAARSSSVNTKNNGGFSLGQTERDFLGL